MSWFTALCNALAYWLQIQAVKAYYELQLQIAHDTQVTEEAIDRLRDTGDSAATLATDRLRDQLAARTGIFVPKPPDRPADPAPAQGPAGADAGRSVRPGS